jgi:ABC-2 type transport system permease protein
MLADAVRSEVYRLVRNRMAVFWSVLFVPLAFAIGGVGFHLLTKSRTAEMGGELAKLGLGATMGRMPVDLGQELVGSAGHAANGAALVFMLIGAATLYAGDYRWETWRLTSARNTRFNLILGKVGAFKILALAAIVAFLIAGLVFSMSQAFIYGRPLGFTLDVGDVGMFLMLVLLSFIRLVQYAMIALLTAVVTRSLLAALFVPVVLGFGQSLLGGPGIALLGWQPTDWQTQLLLPGLAFDTLKAVVGPEGVPANMPEGLVLKAVVGLALWTLAPLAAAIAWFSRQDLSKE